MRGELGRFGACVRWWAARKLLCGADKPSTSWTRSSAARWPALLMPLHPSRVADISVPGHARLKVHSAKELVQHIGLTVKFSGTVLPVSRVLEAGIFRISLSPSLPPSLSPSLPLLSPFSSILPPPSSLVLVASFPLTFTSIIRNISQEGPQCM